MTFDDMLAAHGRGLSSEAHGSESVTYHREGVADRIFFATVLRQGNVSVSGSADRALRRRAVVVVPIADSDGEQGVSQVLDGDRITVVLQRGQPAVRCRINRVINSDAHGWHVEVQG